MLHRMASKRLHSPQPWSACASRKLEFFAPDRARDHFATRCYDSWCDLCQKSFEGPEKTRQHMSTHLDLSSRCPRCAFDAGSGGGLLKHWRETGCHRECPVCKVWCYRECHDVHFEFSPHCRRQTFRSKFTQNMQPSNGSEQETLFEPQVYKGVEIEKEDGMGTKPSRNYLQTVCRPAFDPPSGPTALNTNKQKIDPRELKKPPRTHCPGCSRKFSLPASLISHLEAGSCPSMINMLDVNYTFATYSEAEILLPSDNRKSLGCFLNYEDIQKTNPFRCCRASCGLPFSVLSGLIQHMDSHRYKVSCGQQSIVDHLRINVYYQSVLHKIQKMTSTNPATIFVTLPPHQVHKTFLRLPEHWHLMSSELTLYLLSALGNISCGKPNDQGRNFLAFKNPHDMRKVLDSIGDLVTRLRDELQEIAAAQAAKGDNGPDQILVYFGTTEEAHSLARFLNDVDKFKKALSNELPG